MANYLRVADMSDQIKATSYFQQKIFLQFSLCNILWVKKSPSFKVHNSFCSQSMDQVAVTYFQGGESWWIPKDLVLQEVPITV